MRRAQSAAAMALGAWYADEATDQCLRRSSHLRVRAWRGTVRATLDSWPNWLPFAVGAVLFFSVSERIRSVQAW